MALKIRAQVAGVSLCLLLSVIPLARAQEVESPQARYQGFLKSAETLQVLDEAAAGVSIDPYTGAMSIRQTDLSVPGTGLPIAITRTFQAGGTRMLIEHAFGDWELELPYLSGVFGSGTNGGWTIEGPSPTQRCSGPATDEFLPRYVTGDGTNINYAWDPWEYFGGYDFHLPTGGSTPLLRYLQSDTFRPTKDGPYGWTANGGWSFGCVPALAFGGTGEGFVALSPDGVRYVFDVMVSRAHTSLKTNYLEPKADDFENSDPAYAAWLRRIEQGHAQMNGGGGTPTSDETPSVLTPGSAFLRRREFRLLPSRAEDRFGNWVRYVYDAGRLIQMQASDGRQISLTRNADGKITAVSDGQRTVTYQYTRSAKTVQDDGYSLSGATLPDNSAWGFSLSGLAWAVNGDQSKRNDAFGCTEDWTLPLSSLTGSITSPAGGVYSYLLQTRLNGLVYTARVCGSKPYSVSGTPQPTLSVQTKSVSGPGLAGGTWTYSYNEGSSKTAPVPVGITQIEKLVALLAPDGSSTQFVYRTMVGVPFQDTRPIQQRTVSAGVILSSVETASLASASGQTYLASIGLEPLARVGSHLVVHPRPVVQQTTTQQGTTFIWQVNNSNGIYSFDRFANPLSVTQSSAGGAGGAFSRGRTTAYEHNTSNWVLNQVKSVSDVATGKVISQTDYDATTALPIRIHQFGVLQQSLSYSADGSLASVKDGRNNMTTLSNWYRGVPRLISYPNSASESATVSALGQILSTTDELGSASSYSYDAIGRLAGITYPSGDSTAWNGTTRSVVRVTVAEYGIPAGHWKQTVATGNGKATTYYDGQWHPVLTLTEDTGNAASKSFVINRYDAFGRGIFSSYPVGSLTSVSDSLPGTRTFYDALGRAIRREQDSELGVLTSTAEYLPGFQIRATNPRGFQTTTTYQAFDGPSTDAPVQIVLPEGVTTSVARDGFGKPLSVTRSGSYAGSSVSAIRSYVYDSSERLCKTINPESGAALVHYDLAGNIDWSADGTAYTNTAPSSCATDLALVAASAKTTRTYDAMNRVTAVVTPGGTANLDTLYAADGLVTQLTAANPGNAAHPLSYNVVTSYTYNKRRLLTAESSSNPSTLYTLGYAYTANGHLSALTYPDSQIVSTAPDALGRTTAVTGSGGQTYASAISYFPNGAIAQFSYGNGIVHTMTRNTRQLPSRSVDAFGTTKIIDDSYAFDANGNVDYVTDAAVPSGALNRNRDLGYDQLDRLIVADAPNQWGNATYAYDALDNLRVADQGLRRYRYNYDAVTNRLTDIKSPANATLFSLAYDANGNTIGKTAQGGAAQGFVYDAANRMNQVTGSQVYRYDGQGRRVQTTDNDGKTTFWIYSQSGQVLYSSEARRNQNISYIYLGNTQVATRTVAWAPVNTVTVRYQHADSLGSIVAETDAGRTVVKRNSYAPYGEAWNSTIDGTGYTGHVMDAGTGLTYMQQRYYDPQVGRLLSVDPVSADANAGGNFNRYWYANNNPYSFTDPDGRLADIILDVGFVAYSSYKLATEPSWVNAAALGADLVGAAVPFATGLGAAVRTGAQTADAARTAREILVTNRARGVAGEAATRSKLGDTKFQDQVSFRTSKGTLTRADFVTADGRIIESKTGNARLSKGQQELADDIKDGRAVTPVGRNAEAAGYKSGEAVRFKTDAYEVDRHQ